MEGDVETAPCSADDPLSAEGNMMEMIDGDEEGGQQLYNYESIDRDSAWR